MSSRRILKKNIHAAMDLLYADCIFYKVFVIDANKEGADKLMHQISDIHSELLNRVSVNEGKEAKNRVKLYYKKLRQDLKQQSDAIGKQIAELSK